MLTQQQPTPLHSLYDQKPSTAPTGTKRKHSLNQKTIASSRSALLALGANGSSAQISQEPTDPFVSVFLSIRRPDPRSENEYLPFRYDIMQDEQTIQLHHPNAIQSFCTNRIFHLGGVLSNTLDDPGACFADMYHHVLEPLVVDCMRGYSTCTIAYGQSGSGKTYNLFSKKYGLFWKALKDLYQRTDESAKSAKYEIQVSVIEVWDKQVNDLLGNVQTKKLRVSRDIGASVEGCEEKRCSTLRDAQRVVEAALKRRAVQATNLNTKASRAHLIVRLIVTRRKGTDGKRVSKMDFVDLAGAMRMMNMGTSNFSSNLSTSTNDMGLSESERDQVSERSGINVSLTTLGKVILQLSKQGDQGFVSYRDSLLTQLLRDVLGGNCRTVLLACMSDEMEYLEDSLSTLRFAERAKHIKNNPIPNEDASPAVVIDDLKDHITALQGEISRYAQSIHMHKSEIEQQQQEVLQARSQIEIFQRLDEDFQELQKKYKFQEDQHQIMEEQHRTQQDALIHKISQLNLQLEKEEQQSKEKEKSLSDEINALKEAEKEHIQAKLEQVAETKRIQNSLIEAECTLADTRKEAESIQEKLIDAQNEIAAAETEKENISYNFNTKIKNLEVELEIVQKKLVQNREELEKQVQDLKNEREDSLKQFIQQQKDNMMYMNKKSQEHQNELNVVKKRYQEELENTLTEHREALRKLEEDGKRELDLIKTHLNQQLDDTTVECESLRSQIESLKVSHINELNSTRSTLEAEIEMIKEHNRKHMQDLSANHQEELENIIQLQKKKVSALKEELTQSHNNELSQMKTQHEEALEKVHQELEEERKMHSEEIEQLQRNQEELLQKKDGEMKTQQKEHEVFVEGIRASHKMDIETLTNDLSKEHATAMESLKNEFAKQSESAMKDNEEQIASLINDHAKKIEELEKSNQLNISSLSKSHEEDIKTLTLKHEKELETFSAQHDREKQLLQDSHEADISILKEQHAADMEAQKTTFKTEKDALLHNHEEALNRERGLNDELSEATESLKKAIAEKDEKIHDLNKDLEDLKAKLSSSEEQNKRYQTWIEKHKQMMLSNFSEI